jgi:hypothetical protein
MHLTLPFCLFFALSFQEPSFVSNKSSEPRIFGKLNIDEIRAEFLRKSSNTVTSRVGQMAEGTSVDIVYSNNETATQISRAPSVNAAGPWSTPPMNTQTIHSTPLVSQTLFVLLVEFSAFLACSLFLVSGFQKFQLGVVTLLQFGAAFATLVQTQNLPVIEKFLGVPAASLLFVFLIFAFVSMDALYALMNRTQFFQKLGADTWSSFHKSSRQFSVQQSYVFAFFGVLWPSFLFGNTLINITGSVVGYFLASIYLVWLTLRFGISAEEGLTFLRLKRAVKMIKIRVSFFPSQKGDAVHE